MTSETGASETGTSETIINKYYNKEILEAKSNFLPLDS